MSSSQDDLINLPENELVKLTQQGNADAFTILFEQYRMPISRYLAGMVGNAEDAYDLTQQAFIIAWNKLQLLHNEALFKPWLFRIARNLAYDYIRLQARGRSQSLDRLAEHSDDADGVGDIVNEINLEDETEVKELTRLALAKIPSKYRACLLLHVTYGLPKSEIAQALRISEGSVTTYIVRARESFRLAYNRLKSQSLEIDQMP